MVQEIGDNCWKKTWLKRVDFAGKSFRHASVFSTYHWRLKYTEVQSQQMAFTQSSKASNNPKIHTLYLIFTVFSTFHEE